MRPMTKPNISPSTSSRTTSSKHLAHSSPLTSSNLRYSAVFSNSEIRCKSSMSTGSSYPEKVTVQSLEKAKQRAFGKAVFNARSSEEVSQLLHNEVKKEDSSHAIRGSHASQKVDVVEVILTYGGPKP